MHSGIDLYKKTHWTPVFLDLRNRPWPCIKILANVCIFIHIKVKCVYFYFLNGSALWLFWFINLVKWENFVKTEFCKDRGNKCFSNIHGIIIKVGKRNPQQTPCRHHIGQDETHGEEGQPKMDVVPDSLRNL